MRRKDKEITDRKLLQTVLEEANTCRIAMCDGDMPYVIPMNFGYNDGCIYLHSANEGRKIDILKKNPKICFEVEAYASIKKSGTSACNTGMRYLSVIGTGEAEFLNGDNEKKEALDIIMKKITGISQHEYSSASLASVTIIRIIVKEITGKKSE